MRKLKLSSDDSDSKFAVFPNMAEWAWPRIMVVPRTVSRWLLSLVESVSAQPSVSCSNQTMCVTFWPINGQLVSISLEIFLDFERSVLVARQSFQSLNYLLAYAVYVRNLATEVWIEMQGRIE